MRRVARYYCAFLLLVILIAGLSASSGSSALELNQAIESCRASKGRPIYMACMQGGGTHPACFARAKSVVQPCVRSAMVAARPKAVLFSAEKLSAAPTANGKPSAAELA